LVEVDRKQNSLDSLETVKSSKDAEHFKHKQTPSGYEEGSNGAPLQSATI